MSSHKKSWEETVCLLNFFSLEDYEHFSVRYFPSIAIKVVLYMLSLVPKLKSKHTAKSHPALWPNRRVFILEIIPNIKHFRVYFYNLGSFRQSYLNQSHSVRILANNKCLIMHWKSTEAHFKTWFCGVYMCLYSTCVTLYLNCLKNCQEQAIEPECKSS